MTKEVAYIELLRLANKAVTVDPDRYQDKVKYTWFNNKGIVNNTCI
jgi:hypothetical protein